MTAIRVHFRDRKLWSESGTTYTRGSAYLDDTLVSNSSLPQVFSRQRTFNGFLSALKQLNGFFAVVHQVDDATFLAVDHVRSCPLFYSVGMKEFYVSDDPYWIQEQIGEHGVDELSAAEFLLAGYVTGNDTLSPHVKQVQAGEALAVASTSGTLRVTPAWYYEYGLGNYFTESREKLLARLDDVLKSVFKRLIRWADGRTIVVPLSGGIESRTVVLMLKRLGYDNIVAFSYGREGNKESSISKRAASTLGIRWEFIPYSNEAWHKWYRSEEWEMYWRMASGLSSVPHIQDWPAVWELQRQQLIPQDSVFVPAHLAGNQFAIGMQGLQQFHLVSSPTAWSKRRVINRNRVANQKELLAYVCRAFYPLRDWSKQRAELEPKLTEKIVRLLGTRPTYKTEDAFDTYRRWWWQGGDSKFLVNSVRVYNFWGYEWWLPLWDLEIANFWSRVPIIHRFERNLSKAHFKELEMKMTKCNIGVHRGDPRPISFVGNLLRKTPLYSQARRIYGLVEYDRHSLAWYGIIPKKVFSHSFTGKENINSYLASDLLERIIQDSNRKQGSNKLRNDLPHHNQEEERK